MANVLDLRTGYVKLPNEPPPYSSTDGSSNNLIDIDDIEAGPSFLPTPTTHLYRLVLAVDSDTAALASAPCEECARRAQNMPVQDISIEARKAGLYFALFGSMFGLTIALYAITKAVIRSIS